VQVRSHDFPEKDTVTITPCGIYDIAASRGFVSVGTSCGTAAFAVNAIRLWWQEEGSLRYPGATRLLVTCDSGGSGSARCRPWKDQLARFAEQARPRPAGRPEPPRAHRHPGPGHDRAGRGPGSPVRGPPPAAVPDPARPPHPRRPQRRPHGNRRLDVTGHLLALRLRDHLDLPVKAAGALLGIDPGTVSHATALAGELLAAARITLPDAPLPGKPPRTPDELLAYAAAAGIPLTLPENGQAMPDHFRTRRNRVTPDTPETAD
jgi:hypothetical protein